MSRFKICSTSIEGLQILERQPIGDSRGYFERVFCETDLKDLLNGRHILQINQSFTISKGAVRGLHFQSAPHAEMKILSCLRGEVWDVAVDLRAGSKTFLKWHAEILSENNHRALLIPEGFAHGFQTITDNCTMLYLHTAAYCQTAEGGLHTQDPHIRISWPLPIAEISRRDASHPLITDDFKGLQL
ncbi:MAG TPA: dTDP-4-dehydrorhamnose 3,5-epimerase family protein [Chitinispirillaceae bacterium]|nr:dTDP-4-dehydrorhamnose 3,5-epimerase family protein [Chitinispirillaceae bacterium]